MWVHKIPQVKCVLERSTIHLGMPKKFPLESHAKLLLDSFRGSHYARLRFNAPYEIMTHMFCFKI